VQLLLKRPLKVTNEPALKERDGLAASNALYHLPTSLSAYGDIKGYDLGSAVGLLEYVVNFVNRPLPRTRIGTEEPFKGVLLGPTTLHGPREKLKKLLYAATSGDPDLLHPSEDLISRCSNSSEIHWEHALERAPGGAEWRHHAHILGAEAFYNLILSLLMSPQNRAALAQCKHEPCGKFFMVEKPVKGRPQSVFHDEKCRKAANDGGAAARQRAKRARDAALKLHGGASKFKAAADIKLAQLAHPHATPEELISHVRRARKHK
jgi:hypothetical protein